MTPEAKRGERPAATLELTHDGGAVRAQGDDLVVGRTAKCAVRVVHPLVSREHCRFELRPDGAYVVDLGSANGTWINGTRIEARTPARAGDRLGLGRDGAVLVVERALVGGVDVTRLPRQEDVETLHTGDPRAAGAVARVAVSPAAVPERSSLDEPTMEVRAEAEAPTAEAPPPVAPAVAPVVGVAPKRRPGFARGLVVGFVVGLAVVAALAKFTHALDGVRAHATEPRPR